MKILPIITCRDCRAMFELDPEDFEKGGPVREELVNTRWTVACPACTSLQNVPRAMALDLRDRMEAVKAKEKTAKEEPDAVRQEEGEGKDERTAKALEAKAALDEAGGNYTAAATKLGVVPLTIKNRLKYLPAEMVSSGEKA